MHHRPRGLHHRVLLVVLDQVGEGVERLAAAGVEPAVLEGNGYDEKSGFARS